MVETAVRLSDYSSASSQPVEFGVNMQRIMILYIKSLTITHILNLGLDKLR